MNDDYSYSGFSTARNWFDPCQAPPSETEESMAELIDQTRRLLGEPPLRTGIYQYVVLYIVEEDQNPPFVYQCEARNAKRAVEQMLDAVPDCLMAVHVQQGKSPSEAYRTYWENWLDE